MQDIFREVLTNSCGSSKTNTALLTVKLISTKQSGTVESIEGEQLTVLFGFSRMKVERSKLMWVKD